MCGRGRKNRHTDRRCTKDDDLSLHCLDHSFTNRKLFFSSNVGWNEVESWSKEDFFNLINDNLKRLLHYSRRMAGFQSRARYVKRAVDEVLESGLSETSHKDDS